MTEVSFYVSLAGTCIGIILGMTPIYPFYKIITGNEKVTIFPESMIFFNILCPMLWATYWLRQANFVPFFSSGVGMIQGEIFCLIYLYFYLKKSFPKWILGVIGQFALTYALYYICMNVIPSWERIGNIATVIGIINTIAPAQNIVKVCKERSYKLIPIASTIAQTACTGCWLLFGILIWDYNTIIVNGICTAISLTNTFIWFYFFCTRKEEKDEKAIELKDSEKE